MKPATWRQTSSEQTVRVLCSSDRPVRMERSSGVDPPVQTSDGGLKELVLRWFTETQAPLILDNGHFPDWFQGFAARKDTEDLLRDKALGCFLIRLSDKALGYILSYKGNDRCRHFVITQNPEGQFIIRGDCQTHSSLTELLEFYKVSPIQPFGEYLTSSFNEVNSDELYDVVNYRNKGSGVSVQALRNLWDQKNDDHSDSDNRQKIQQQNDPPTAHPPVLPLKSKGRKLTGAVSVDTVSLSQVAPPVPKRGLPLGVSLSGSLPDTTSHQSETKTEPNKTERLRGSTNPDRDSFTTTDTSYPGDLCPPGITYSELTLVENRSRSLPKLNNNPMEEEEEEYSNQLSSPSFTSLPSHSPTPMKRATCHTYSLNDPRDSSRPSSSRSELQADDVLRANPLYQTSERPGGSSAQQGGVTYAEVSQRQAPAGLSDDTYEQVPGEAAAVQGNTYESLEDMKNKKSKSTWGKNNINWKKFLPDYKKK